jgi:hypothetical protein
VWRVSPPQAPHVGYKCHELITAKAADDVARPLAFTQAFGCRNEQLIANLVSVAIVDLFERI